MLTNGQRMRIDIPHEPGEWLVIRPLPWPLLAAAATERTRRQTGEAAALLESLPNIDAQRDALTNAANAQRANSHEAPAPIDPANVWDRRIVLRAGIVEWSYGDPFDADQIDDLDEQTADWAFRAILAPATRTEQERIEALVPFPNISTA